MAAFTPPAAAPLLWLQNPRNRTDVLACARCGAARPGDQLRHLAGRHGNGEKTSPGLAGQVDATEACECGLGCGIVYCSPTCRALDAAAGHAQLCVGPHSDTHPFYKYVVLALESGDAYAEFVLAARMSVLASLGSGHQSSSASQSSSGNSILIAQATAIWTSIARDTTIPFWWTLVSTEMLPFEAERYTEAAEELVREAWELLQKGMQMGRRKAFYADFNYSHFGRILTFLSREKINLTVPSSLETHISAMAAVSEQDWDVADVATLTGLAQSIARTRLREVLADEDDFYDSEELHDVRRLRVFLDAAPVKAMRMIIAEPALYLTPPLALICIPSVDAVGLPHSCVPTTRIQALFLKGAAGASPIDGASLPKSHSYKGHSTYGGIAVQLVSTNTKKRSRQPDAVISPTTLSKIDDVGSLDLAERAEMLALCGLVCDCDRCKYEKEERAGKGGSLPIRSLVSLALAAQEQERYAQAEVLWNTIIAKAPATSDVYADALYNRARLVGWRDRWSASDRMFVEAGRLAPAHAGVTQWLEESRSYATLGDDDATCGDVALKTRPDISTAAEHALFGGRAFVRMGVLTSEECALTVNEVEAHVAASPNGWTTSRHYAVPTTDIPVHAVPSVLERFNRILVDRIYPLMAAQFQVKASRIRVIDAFVVKYSAERQRSLPLHCDQSQFSLTITLNAGDEYEGGVTYFAEAGEIVNCNESGAVISFEGSLLHGGHPITRGTRYIIVAFLYAYKEEEEEEEEEAEKKEV